VRTGHSVSGGGLARARAVLGSRDFRRLLAARTTSQLADGLFLAAVLLTVVFLPEQQSTVRGFALATTLFLLPFSLLGPFAGVFVDRWRRRRILVAVPLVRAGASLLILPGTAAIVLVYVGTLLAFSAARLYQATSTAVMPRVLGAADPAGPMARQAPRRRPDTRSTGGSLLFDANTVAAIGGSAALFGGLFAGGHLAVGAGVPAVIVLACAAWSASALLGSSLSSSLPPEGPAPIPLGGELTAVTAELGDGFHRIRTTPAALAPILAVAVGQFLQMLVIVVSLVVIKEGLKGGLVSFSWLVAAGGAGVFLGFLTVGSVGRRVPRHLLIGLAFALSAVSLIPAIAALSVATLSGGAVLLGASYAWTRVPADTLAQQAVPDRYRGRVFTVMDLGFNIARVLGALVAIPVVPRLGPQATLAAVAVLFLLWAPVTPLWLGGGRAGAPPSAE
jgi:MFS family permease